MSLPDYIVKTRHARGKCEWNMVTKCRNPSTIEETNAFFTSNNFIIDSVSSISREAVACPAVYICC